MGLSIALWIVGAGLSLSGPALAAWALFGDRSRARRCRRCWYEMEGVPGLVCPECGREAREERVLARRRRRWRLVAAAALLTLAGAGAMAHAELSRRDRGWWTIAPDRVVIESIARTTLWAPRSELWARYLDQQSAALSYQNWSRLAHACAEELADSSRPQALHSWSTMTLGDLVPDQFLVDAALGHLLEHDDDAVRSRAIKCIELRSSEPSDQLLRALCNAAMEIDRPSASGALEVLNRSSLLDPDLIRDFLLTWDATNDPASPSIETQLTYALLHMQDHSVPLEQQVRLLRSLMDEPRASDRLKWIAEHDLGVLLGDR